MPAEGLPRACRGPRSHPSSPASRPTVMLVMQRRVQAHWLRTRLERTSRLPGPLCRGPGLHWVGARQGRPAGAPSWPWPCSTALPTSWPLSSSEEYGWHVLPLRLVRMTRTKVPAPKEPSHGQSISKPIRGRCGSGAARKATSGKGLAASLGFSRKAPSPSHALCPARSSRGGRGEGGEGGKGTWPIRGFRCRLGGPGWGLCKLWCPSHWDRPSVEEWMGDSWMEGHI